MKLEKCLSLLRIAQFIAVTFLLVWPAAASAQTVVATIPVGAAAPHALAVNPVSNKIYVASCTIHAGLTSLIAQGVLMEIDGGTNAASTVSSGCAVAVAVNPVTNKIYAARSNISNVLFVLDGASNSTTTLSGAGGNAVAVNPVTNKIYVAEGGGIINVIDGATNSITTVTDPNAFSLNAAAIAVNPVTNKIYIANNGIGINGNTNNTNPGNVTVIDGATNSTTTLTDPNAVFPVGVAVNSATNKVYVANAGNYPTGMNHGNVTVIDGATNSVTTVTDPNALSPGGPDSRGFAVAVNSATNKVYVSNEGSNNVTVIDGATNATTTIAEPSTAAPIAVAVDSATNTIYVANNGTNPGSVTVINGATNAATTVMDPKASAPNAIAVNPATNKIYVTNSLSLNTTVIDAGATATSHILSVLLAGNGLGSVTSNPAGINCGTSCTVNFGSGSAVNLTSSPASGSELSGWSTNCTGTAACSLTMSTDYFVTATFGTTTPPDFSLQPASASLTAQFGSQVTDVIAIAPVAGTAFRSPIQLSCAVTGPATVPICTLSSTSVTPGANSATSTLTVVVGAPPMSAGLIPSSEGHPSSPLYAVLLPIPLVLIGFSLASGKSKQHTRQLWLIYSIMIAFVALQAGCGGKSNPPPVNYTVTVTATSGTIQHTTQVTVTVP